MNFNQTVNMEWACMYCQICPPPPLYYHHFDCSLSFSRDSTDTRHLRVFSSARNSLRKRAIQHPDSTHTHLYIYLSSLNKIPGLMLCVSCVFIGTVPLSFYIYSPTGSAHLLPPHLTLFLRFYTTSWLFINFFSRFLYLFDLADDGWIILPKKDPSSLQKFVKIKIHK